MYETVGVAYSAASPGDQASRWAKLIELIRRLHVVTIFIVADIKHTR